MLKIGFSFVLFAFYCSPVAFVLSLREFKKFMPLFESGEFFLELFEQFRILGSLKEFMVET